MVYNLSMETTETILNPQDDQLPAEKERFQITDMNGVSWYLKKLLEKDTQAAALRAELETVTANYAFTDHKEWHGFPDGLHPNTDGYNFLAANDANFVFGALSIGAAAPEPASLLLVALGGVVFIKRRRG